MPAIPSVPCVRFTRAPRAFPSFGSNSLRVILPLAPSDAVLMYLNGAGGTVAIAGYRGRHFQGYAIRTPNGWTCVVSLGMTWSKFLVRSAEDARVTLRTMSHASRFEMFTDIDELIAVIHKLPPFQQPGILPEHISGFPAKLPKLVS